MTYEESQNYLNKYSHVLTQKISNNGLEQTIKYLFIAPKDYPDKKQLIKLIFMTGNSNEKVLFEAGLINSNLEVYYGSSPKNSDEFTIGVLYDYLSASDQL